MLQAIGEVAAKVVEAVGESAEKAGELFAKTTEIRAEVDEPAIKETNAGKQIEQIVLKPNMTVIKETSLKSLMLENAENHNVNTTDVKSVVDLLREKANVIVDSDAVNAVEDTEAISAEKTGLTEDEKAKIIEDTEWSTEIVDCIDSMEQYEVYKNANLHEVEIDGRKCLVKDIDMDYVDPKTIDANHPDGMTNRELMEKGRPPYDTATGERLELHHMGQDFNSPFAELAENSEHGDGKDAILHDKKVESWRQNPEKKNHYNNVQRPNHWKGRSQEG